MFGSSDPIQAGEFEIPRGHGRRRRCSTCSSMAGRSQRLITIPEGMPSILVQEKLAAMPELTGAAPLPAEGVGPARQL